jgi:AraC-like DNA-binding protein
MAREAFGEGLGERFGVNNVPVLVAKTLHKTQVPVTLIETQHAASVMSEPLAVEDAFLVHFNLRAAPEHELWVGDRALGKCTFGEGETAIHDLKRPPRALIHTPMGSMMFYLSRQVLNEVCDDASAPRIEDLHLQAGTSVDDPTIRHLSNSIYSAMQRPDQATPLFVDHVTVALAIHVAETFGGMRRARPPSCRGLAPWQERRAKEMLSSRLDGSVSLQALAAECGVSAGHFARLFRQSVGEPPHRWLLRQRLERAKMLLRDGGLSLAQVALACGFCDQSHLTRCFKEGLGVSPGAWRGQYDNFSYDRNPPSEDA